MPAGESARVRATEFRAKASEYRALATDWEAGAVGEERVAAALDCLDPQMTRVLHDRLLSAADSKVNLDHLVVSAGGIFLIDAKNWTGDVTVHNESLWQHWTSKDGRKNAVKDGELSKVRKAAIRVKELTGQHVTPVLCLAGDRSEYFGAPRVVGNVNVVAVHDLVAWLEAQPPTRKVTPVGTLGVQLSCQFPPAVGGGQDVAALEWSMPAPQRPAVRGGRERTRTASAPRPPASTQRHRSGIGRTLPRLVAGAAAVIALIIFGPKAIGALGNATAHTVQNALPKAPTTTPARSHQLSAAQAQRLDDWSIRAGLYRSNDEPGSLPFEADAYLGDQSAQCRTQATTLAPFRHGLLKAPDARLAADAKRFDVAVHQVLHACMTDHPVALHHAEGVVAVAASRVNTRYDRLLGQDPKAYNATHVL